MSRTEHQRANELLPWLVNGTLQGEELGWLRAHLDACALCRDEQRVQLQLRDTLTAQPAVEFAPQPSFNRLWHRIENNGVTGSSDSSRPPSRTAPRWLVGGLALQAAIIVVLLAMVLRSAPPTTSAAEYRTVTSGAAVPTAALQVVFDDAVTVGDVRVILGRTGLTVLSGPTAAGVYVLVPDGLSPRTTPEQVLALLRSDPRVRFADRQ